MKYVIAYFLVLVINAVSAGFIALILRSIYGKNLTYKIFLWLIPGISILVANTSLSTKLGGFANPMAVIATTVAGLVVMVVNFILVGKFLVRNLTNISDDISKSASEVNSASAMVSASSQTLAEGSSEHASALEETSASLEEMSSMTKQNADNAAQARAFTAEAKQVVDKVDGQMHRMVTAIQEVTKSSEETGKIIKTIDEIAFQTNLLALNAAVEAARAGEAGAGFAVVADEVRNLAMRAAEAAKNTSSLIENTIVTVKNSRDLTEQTQNSFRENIEISNKIGQLIDEIATASNEQAQGIGQIGKAVAEMDKVVQNTAASAEESASASEEMNAESVKLNNQVSKLRTLVNGTSDARKGDSPATARHEKPATQKSVKPVARKQLPAASHHIAKGKPVRPEKVIPFDKEDFKDF